MSEDGGRRKGLGRGLSALLGDNGSEDYAALDKLRTSKSVPIESLKPNRYQPRRHFDEEQLDHLAESIRDKGMLQPILVRRFGDQPNAYEIIAGERRWRAAQRAQLHEVPVLIKDLTDLEALEVALVENVQRQDLTAIEEALGYKRLADEFGYTQEQLAHGVGKSRSHIANLLRLLTLPPPVQWMVETGELTAGHARALIGTSDPETLAKRIVEQGLTVRQIEQLVAGANADPEAPLPSEPPPKTGRKSTGGEAVPADAAKDADTLALERSLSTALGLKVAVQHRGDRGEIKIFYSDLDQLDDLCHRLIKGAPIPAPEEDPLEPGDTGQDPPGQI